MTNGNSPARIWLGTIPYSVDYCLNSKFDGSVAYAKGQREIGQNTNYEHWQVIVYFKKPVRLSHCKKTFGTQSHWEPTRSAAADDYVWKDDTAVDGSRFEWGTKSIRRNERADWDAVVADARSGRLDQIPSDILVRCYGNLRRLAADNLQPIQVERTCKVYWGATGTGKSHRAWSEAGLDAYPKDPRTKFWDGYNGQDCVIIDEFRGGIDISHILRWLDKWPVIVEIKGSSIVLKATKIFITSNLDPRLWYPDIDDETKSALLRRLQITYFPRLIN